MQAICRIAQNLHHPCPFVRCQGVGACSKPMARQPPPRGFFDQAAIFRPAQCGADVSDALIGHPAQTPRRKRIRDCQNMQACKAGELDPPDTWPHMVVENGLDAR